MDLKEIIKEENLIGIGTSRAVFALDKNKVIKLPLWWFGEEQSKNEYNLYQKYKDIYKGIMTGIFSIDDKGIIICERVETLKGTGDISCSNNISEEMYFESEEEFIQTLANEGYMIDDLYLRQNRGIRDNKLVLLDFGAKLTGLNISEEMVYNYICEAYETMKDDENIVANTLNYLQKQYILN